MKTTSTSKTQKSTKAPSSKSSKTKPTLTVVEAHEQKVAQATARVYEPLAKSLGLTVKVYSVAHESHLSIVTFKPKRGSTQVSYDANGDVWVMSGGVTKRQQEALHAKDRSGAGPKEVGARKAVHLLYALAGRVPPGYRVSLLKPQAVAVEPQEAEHVSEPLVEGAAGLFKKAVTPAQPPVASDPVNPESVGFKAGVSCVTKSALVELFRTVIQHVRGDLNLHGRGRGTVGSTYHLLRAGVTGMHVILRSVENQDALMGVYEKAMSTPFAQDELMNAWASLGYETPGSFDAANVDDLKPWIHNAERFGLNPAYHPDDAFVRETFNSFLHATAGKPRAKPATQDPQGNVDFLYRRASDRKWADSFSNHLNQKLEAHEVFCAGVVSALFEGEIEKGVRFKV